MDSLLVTGSTAGLAGLLAPGSASPQGGASPLSDGAAIFSGLFEQLQATLTTGIPLAAGDGEAIEDPTAIAEDLLLAPATAQEPIVPATPLPAEAPVEETSGEVDDWTSIAMASSWIFTGAQPMSAVSPQSAAVSGTGEFDVASPSSTAVDFLTAQTSVSNTSPGLLNAGAPGSKLTASTIAVDASNALTAPAPRPIDASAMAPNNGDGLSEEFASQLSEQFAGTDAASAAAPAGGAADAATVTTGPRTQPASSAVPQPRLDPSIAADQTQSSASKSNSAVPATESSPAPSNNSADLQPTAKPDAPGAASNASAAARTQPLDGRKRSLDRADGGDAERTSTSQQPVASSSQHGQVVDGVPAESDEPVGSRASPVTDSSFASPEQSLDVDVQVTEASGEPSVTGVSNSPAAPSAVWEDAAIPEPGDSHPGRAGESPESSVTVQMAAAAPSGGAAVFGIEGSPQPGASPQSVERPVAEQFIQSALSKSQVVDRFSRAVYEMTLTPPELGPLRVEMRRTASGLSIRVSASSRDTLALLEAGRGEIEMSLLGDQGGEVQFDALDSGAGGQPSTEQQGAEPALIWGEDAPPAEAEPLPATSRHTGVLA